jgi:hypothetical protein
MSIKFDPDEKFKWIDFGTSAPLTDVQDKQLRKMVQQNYTRILDGLLSQFKLPLCSGSVNMLTSVDVDGKTYINNPLFGIYKTTPSIDKVIESYYPDPDDIVAMKFSDAYLTSHASFLNALPSNIDAIKKKFKECAQESLFVIDLKTYPVTPLKAGPLVTHQNILIIQKNRGSVFWIEPQTIGTRENILAMSKSIKTLVTEIGMVNPTVQVVNVECPQAVTRDSNCMFWAYSIFFTILMNPYETNKNNLIRKFMTKYPTEETLVSYMNGLKFWMKNQMGIAGGKKAARRTKRLRKLKSLKKIR